MLRIRPALQFALLASVVSCFPAGRASAQKLQYSTEHRDHTHSLEQSLTGPAKLTASLRAQRSAVSLAVAEFHEDGTKDLVTGYATADGGALVLQRGSTRALAPAPADWARIARGEMLAPFVAKAESVAIPVRPELMKTADVSGHGHSDVLVAQKGDTSVYVLRSNGKGGFSAPEAFAAGGKIASLTTWMGPEGENFVVAGVCGASGCGLQFLSGDGTVRSFVSITGTPSTLELAALNGGTLSDFAVIAGDSLVLVDGDSALSGSPAMETLPVSRPTAVAPGNFVYDRRGLRQLAVLDAAGTLHVLTRGNIDNSFPTRAEVKAEMAARAHTAASTPRVKLNGNVWVEAETLPNIGSGDGATPLMVRGRFNGGGYDELAVMSGTKYVLVSHPTTFENNTGTTTSVVTVDTLAAPVVAALSTRVAADARTGLVTADAHAQPLIAQLPANRTINVNTTTDAVPNATSQNACTNNTAGCTLRAALVIANNDYLTSGITKADTINIPAGTYTITSTNNGSTFDSQADYNYHYNIDSSVNLIGAGAATTIINANSLDQIFEVNSGVVRGTSGNAFYSPTTIDVYISGLTLQNAVNKNDPTSVGCNAATTATQSPFCLDNGGAITVNATGGGNFTLNNVTISGSSAVYAGNSNSGADGKAEGGALWIGNSTAANLSTLEINNSTFLNNTAGGNGGAISSIGPCVQFSLSNDTFTGNWAGKSTSAASQGTYASGGGFWGDGTNLTGGAGSCTTEGTSTLTTITASGNKATDAGGAIHLQGPFTASGLTLTGNTAGAFGGGLYFYPAGFGGTVTTSTFTGNTLIGNPNTTYSGGGGNANGAGVCVDNGVSGNSLTMHYSRFFGNTIAGALTGLKATGLGVPCAGTSSQQVTVNATDNWWGCNPTTFTNAIAGTGCDTAATSANGTNSLTVSPYTTLTLAVSGTSIVLGNSITATASLGQDSTPTVYSSTNAAAYLATPITTFTLTNTVTPTYNPSAVAFSSSASGVSNAAATATANTNASGSSTATVTVDGQTLTKSYTVVAPPDLTVTSAHTGNFRAGDTGDTYTLTVTNSGGSSTSATVTLVDTLPTGFTATALSGTGWSCTLGTLTCTRSDALGASSSYPAVTLTVSISGSTIGTVNNSVTVSGGGETNTANDSYTDSTIVTAGPAATLTVSGFPSPTASGATGTITVTAKDTFGNTATSFTGTVHITSSDGAATLPGDYTFVAADNGVHTLSVTLRTAGTQSITATSTVTSSINGSQTGIVVTPGAAATLTVGGFPNPTVSGAAGSITVTAKDAASNTATGFTGTIHFTSTDGLATLPADYTFVAGDNGVHTFSVTLKTAGTQSITATSTVTGTITGTQSGIVVTPGAVTTLLVTGFPTSSQSGVSGNVTVTAKDAAGNTATNFTGTVHITSSDGAANLPADYTYVAGDNGVHLFSVKLNTAGTGRSITATVTSSGATGSQAGITVTPGAAAILTVAAYPSPTVSGAAGTVSVTAKDAAGNTATGFTGTIHFTSSDGLATLPSDYTFVAGDNGVHSFSATLRTAGTQSITATSTVTGTITGTQTGIIVVPGAAATLTVAGFASPVQSGTAGTVTVTAKDAAGNTANGFTGTIHFTSSDGLATLPADYTFVAGDSGVHTFNVTLRTAGTQSITATSTVTGTITGSQAGIVVTVGATSAFTVTAFPSPAQNGTAANVTVTAKDAAGNTTTGFTGTVHFTSTDPLATLPADYTFVAGDNGVHTFSVTLNTAKTQSITVTSTVNGSITGSQTGIVVLDSVWVINANGTLARLTDAGTQTTTAGSAAAASTLGAVAFDAAGDVWSVTNAKNSLAEVSRTGTNLAGTGFTGGGITSPTALAIDGLGQVWVANTNNSVSLFTAAGAAVTPSTGYKGGNMNAPTGIVIDGSGSVWLSNSGNASVTKIIGGAAPVTTPTVTGTTNNTLGTRP